MNLNQDLGTNDRRIVTNVLADINDGIDHAHGEVDSIHFHQELAMTRKRGVVYAG